MPTSAASSLILATDANHLLTEKARVRAFSEFGWTEYAPAAWTVGPHNEHSTTKQGMGSFFRTAKTASRAAPDLRVRGGPTASDSSLRAFSLN